MSKQATYIEEQIQLMQERGMVITDTNKAKEILLDVGYYRLGFYTYTNTKRAYSNIQK